jgi:glycyl-tRNA synthetase beta chain
MPRGEYLLEVRSEEIPSRMLEPGVRELASRLFEELMGRRVGPREIVTGFTPRRLIVQLRGLPAQEPDREEQVLGPPVRVGIDAQGQPTPALLGFARRCGVEPGDLDKVSNDKGEYFATTKRSAGRPIGEILSELVPKLLVAISWPKMMRWGQGEGPWVRPVHGIVSLLDGETVPFNVLGVNAGRETAGHPILSPATFSVKSVADYRSKLKRRGIEIDPAARRTVLEAAMREAAERLGGTLVDDEALLVKLTALCEIPGVIAGGFDPEYLNLPSEVLATSLRDHQSALTVAGPDGKLVPAFLTVMDRADDPQGRTLTGNEWVVAARLADARFFYGEDVKAGLAARAQQLGSLSFHEKLGSYAAKSERIAALSQAICNALHWREGTEPTARAAELLKVDLVTEMVKEFTSLQGVMGGIYARLEGEPEAVWQAIGDQYLPASTDDRLPRGKAALVTGLADRLDTLVGIFGLGLVPTGSRDPFGLRRAAQGAARILLEGDLRLDIEPLVDRTVELYGQRIALDSTAILRQLRPFWQDRIRYLLGLAGFAYDEIEAGLAAGSADLPDLRARVDALHRVRAEPDFLKVVHAAKRIANIVRDTEPGTLAVSRLVEPAEKELAAAAERLAKDLDEATAAGDYDRALRAIATLAPVLDRFFVEVLVMDPDPEVRSNRLALLRRIGASVSRVAALTEMVIDRTEQRAKTAADTAAAATAD